MSLELAIPPDKNASSGTLYDSEAFARVGKADATRLDARIYVKPQGQIPLISHVLSGKMLTLATWKSLIATRGE